jgi:hypothetical protein
VLLLTQNGVTFDLQNLGASCEHCTVKLPSEIHINFNFIAKASALRGVCDNTQRASARFETVAPRVFFSMACLPQYYKRIYKLHVRHERSRRCSQTLLTSRELRRALLIK